MMSYLMYIGETERPLRARFGEYLRETAAMNEESSRSARRVCSAQIEIGKWFDPVHLDGSSTVPISRK